MDPVSKINEFAQRNRCAAPTYSFDKPMGPDHLPMWTCTINMCGEGHASQPNLSKVLAKREAAQLWVDANIPDAKYAASRYMQAPCASTLPIPAAMVTTDCPPLPQSPPQSPPSGFGDAAADISTDAKVVVFVDMENVQQHDAVDVAARAGIRVHAYCAEKWPSLNVMRQRYPLFEWHVSTSGLKDAADVLLIIDLMVELMSTNRACVVIGGDGIHKATITELAFHPQLKKKAERIQYYVRPSLDLLELVKKYR